MVWRVPGQLQQNAGLTPEQAGTYAALMNVLSAFLNFPALLERYLLVSWQVSSSALRSGDRGDPGQGPHPPETHVE